MTECPPRLDSRGRTSRPIPIAWWFGLAGLAGLLLVGWQAPGGQFFYPQCVLYVTTGWQCPGCGITRSTHCLLHGRIYEAWRLNALWVLLLPLILWTYLAWFVNETWNRRWFQPLGTRLGLAVLFGSMAGYGIARNLPWAVWLRH